LVRENAPEAIAAASRCTKDRRTTRAAWNLLAAVHQRMGDTNAAKSASQRAASLPPDAPLAEAFAAEASPARGDARDLSDRSQRLLESGRLAEASPLLSQLVRGHPRFSEGWLLLGRWQVLSHDPQAAETSLRRHLELDAQSLNGLFQLGRALLMQKKFEEAAAAFEKATRLKSDFGPAFHNLGFALARSGRTREAVAPFREAIRHNPDHIDSYILLADLYVQLGEKAAAGALVRQAEAINQADPRLATLRERMAGEKVRK
jgi:tetratricopeptide (TPR) repeat protein